MKIEPFGLMVALDSEIHGLAHVSELSDEPMPNINDKFKVGQELEFEIVSLEPTEHRLGLRLAGVKGKSTRKAEIKEKKVEQTDKPASAPSPRDSDEAKAEKAVADESSK